MAAEAGGDAPAGIGSRLRAAREKKGLTILQAAEKVHLDPRILESLEAEDFAALGAAVYVKGHMRHYAEFVGEQPAELQALYASSAHPAPTQPDLTRISRPLPENDASKFTGPLVMALVAIAAIGSLWWVLNTPSEKPQQTAVQQGATNNPASTPTQSPTPGSDETNTPPVVAVPSPTVKVAKNATSVAAAPTKGGLPPKPAAATATTTSAASAHAIPTSTATVPATAAPAAPTAPPATRAKQGELTLKFSSDSWAEVYDATGQRLFYDVGAASSAHTVRGAAPLRVVLGNASGVALEFNGRPASIPSTVAPDGSVRFVINAHGRAVTATEGN
jgi:cytoskeleton protein RodZ